MGQTWVISAQDRPHVGPMNLAIKGHIYSQVVWENILTNHVLEM